MHKHWLVQTKRSLRFRIERKATHAKQGFIKSAAMGLKGRNKRMQPNWVRNKETHKIKPSRVAPRAKTRGSHSTVKRS